MFGKSKGLGITIGKVTGFIKELNEGIITSTKELIELEDKVDVVTTELSIATNLVVGLNKIVEGE